MSRSRIVPVESRQGSPTCIDLEAFGVVECRVKQPPVPWSAVPGFVFEGETTRAKYMSQTPDSHSTNRPNAKIERLLSGRVKGDTPKCM